MLDSRSEYEAANREPVNVRPHFGGGLWSQVNKITTCLMLGWDARVDWTGGTLYSPPEVNLWNELFEPRPAVPGAKEIIEYPSKLLTGREVGRAYTEVEGPNAAYWRLWANRAWQHIKVRNELYEGALTFEADHFPDDKVIGVLVRAHTHAGEQTSLRSQPLEDYAAALGEIHDSPIYLMCGDDETLAWFSERFHVITHPATKRSKTRDVDRHLTEPQTVEDAKQCLIETLVLSYCATLLHPTSNMATFSLYCNPAQKSVYLP